MSSKASYSSRRRFLSCLDWLYFPPSPRPPFPPLPPSPLLPPPPPPSPPEQESYLKRYFFQSEINSFTLPTKHRFEYSPVSTALSESSVRSMRMCVSDYPCWYFSSFATQSPVMFSENVWFAVRWFLCVGVYVCIIIQSLCIVVHFHGGGRFGSNRWVSENEANDGLLFSCFVFLPVLNACEAGGFVFPCHI